MTDVTISKTLWDTTGGFSHVLGGCVAVLLPLLVLRRWLSERVILAVVSVIFVLYVLLKELLYDPSMESVDERGTAWVDILTYLSGWVLGLIVAFADPRSDGLWTTKKGDVRVFQRV